MNEERNMEISAEQNKTLSLEERKAYQTDLAERKDNPDDAIDFENFVQVVSFLVGGEEYGIEILYIHEINRITQITRIPNTPSFIRGIMNLRGNVIPVVDLREKFGLPFKEFDEESRVIVIEMDGKLIAVIVDSVHQTLRIRNEDVEYTTDMITGISGNYIKGVAKYKAQLIILLKLSNALLEEETDEEKNTDIDD